MPRRPSSSPVPWSSPPRHVVVNKIDAPTRGLPRLSTRSGTVPGSGRYTGAAGFFCSSALAPPLFARCPRLDLSPLRHIVSYIPARQGYKRPLQCSSHRRLTTTMSGIAIGRIERGDQTKSGNYSCDYHGDRPVKKQKPSTYMSLTA